MENNDIPILQKLLKTQNRNDLSSFLDGSTGEVEQTGQFGSYWNSTISYYNIYLPVDTFVKSKKLSDEDKKVILSVVLDLYPHGEGREEIQSLHFYLKRDDANTIPEDDEESVETIGDYIQFKEDIETQYGFLNDQLIKSRELFEKGDYAGVLTAVRSSVEAATFDIYKRITGEEVYGTGALSEDYTKIRNLLNLAPENKTNRQARKLTASLVSIVDAIDQLSNQMGDRHVQKVKPERHHALLCLNSAQSIIAFLYSSLIYQYKEKDTLYNQIINFLYEGVNRSRTKEWLLESDELKFIFSRCDEFTKGLIKKKLISEFKIEHFKDSDVFFKALQLLDAIKKKEDVVAVKKKCIGNSQACGIKDFMSTHNNLINPVNI